MIVIVPAKDEATNIYATLRALYEQKDTQGYPLNKNGYEVILLANNCSDHTAAIARSFACQHPDLRLHVIEKHFPAELAHIGYVRRCLMDEASLRFNLLNKPRGIIASTDGDSMVSQDWVYNMLQAFAQGADAVGGRILTTSQQAAHRRYHLMDVKYRFLQAKLASELFPQPTDPWPRHFQFFGPSLAVSCEMYQRVGGLPAVPYLEDQHFYEALRQHDARIRHCPLVRVHTSTRTVGRVSFGFSKQLLNWTSMQERGELPLVSGLNEQIFRLKFQKSLQEVWQSASYGELDRLSDFIGLPMQYFYEEMLSTPFFGKFFKMVMDSEQMQHYLHRNFLKVPIDEAISQFCQQIRLTYFSSAYQTAEMPPRDPAGIDHAAGVADVLACE